MIRILTFLLIINTTQIQINGQSQSSALDSAQYKRVFESQWSAIGFQYNLHNNIWSKSSEIFDINKSDQNLNSISLKLFGPTNYMEDFSIELIYYLPVNLSINDSTQYKTTGISWKQPLYPSGFDLLFFAPQYKRFQYDLPLFLSFGIGSLFLKENQNKFRNFFFTFDLNVNPRIILFNRLILGGYSGISLDVTKSTWKNRDKITLPYSHKQNQFTYGINLGWILRNNNSYVRVY